MFVIALGALLGVVGTVLWFTGWAESRVIDAQRRTLPAKHR
jgi:hypothetical protein